jgi:tRNA nucleotidyltransferase/poly(A) polymerase
MIHQKIGRDRIKLDDLLTPQENKLFSTILASIQYHKKNTIARVAGGWVRDKLLGRTSDDIDIALDNQSGEDFANNVNDYLKLQGEEVRTIAIIQVISTFASTIFELFYNLIFKG